MKTFLYGAAKIALAVVLAAIMVAALSLVAWKIFAGVESSKAAPYEAVKAWSYGFAQPFGMEVKGKTKLIENRLYADFAFLGYPAYLKSTINQQAGRVITLRFSDKDGFKVHEREIPMGVIRTTVNEKGLPIGLSYEFDEFLTVEHYARFATLGVGWNLDTDARAPGAASVEVVTPKLDPCAPNIRRAERITRLAKFGDMRQTGPQTFDAGDHSIAFFGEEVLSCR